MMLKKIDTKYIFYGIYCDGALRTVTFRTITEAQLYIKRFMLTGAIVVEVRPAFLVVTSY